DCQQREIWIHRGGRAIQEELRRLYCIAHSSQQDRDDARSKPDTRAQRKARTLQGLWMHGLPSDLTRQRGTDRGRRQTSREELRLERCPKGFELVAGAGSLGQGRSLSGIRRPETSRKTRMRMEDP